MKAALIALSVASAAISKPIAQQVPFGSQLHDNVVVPQADMPQVDFHVEGFSLDLNEPRLVQFEGHEPVWISEYQKLEAKANGRKFFDITDSADHFAAAQVKPTKTYDYPELSAQKKVTSVIKTLSTEGPRANLEKFSSFRTRYYRSQTGQESQKWLLSRIQEITAESASDSLQQVISISEFEHSWGQNSIVARINGTSDDERVVVVGAHQDSTNMWPFFPAPGADDDGSGTTSILESYRALLASDFRPARPVEFQWYSAEEGGLLGSQQLATDYANRGVEVYAMSQYDMTAWVKRGTKEVVGVVTDYVDPTLTDYNKKLIKEYLSIPSVDTKCGYACSDHASFAKNGFPSIFTIEGLFDDSNLQNIHSTSDRIDVSPEFSFNHMLEFSKLAVAFAIELGGSEKSA